MNGKIAAADVGVPRSVEWEHQTYFTGIFKTAAKGKVNVGMLGLQGDPQAGWNGFYLAVSKEGEDEAGDSVQLIDSDRHKPTIADIFAAEP